MEAPITESLDPEDWPGLRAQGHRMLDDMLDYLESLNRRPPRPVWQPIPDEARAGFRKPLPRAPGDLAEAHRRFMDSVLPYSVGNAHPAFMGWVHGGGTAVGMLAEILAAGLNANLGGRDHMPIEVERQIVAWMRELFAFPDSASGLFVTGSSMANLIAVLVARTSALGPGVRGGGVAALDARLTAYASRAAHGCIAQAMDIAGLGSEALRLIATDDDYRMDIAALEKAIAADREQGFTPFFICGTAGTVDVGSVDDLTAIAALARREGVWFHVDGAYGALGMLTPELAPLLAGIEQADSIACDFHKWGQVPYDAGFILVRDEQKHRAAFASAAAYLRRDTRGLAAGSPWPCDYGPDLSRGFRALKTWFTLQVYGADRLGRAIAGTCALARHLKARIEAEPELELLAPVALNIVCFRYRAQDENWVNRELVLRLHESGIAAPSTTVLDGRLAIRAAIVNHRTKIEDVEALVAAVLRFGAEIASQNTAKGNLMDTETSPAREPLMGLAALMRRAFAREDMAPLGSRLIARAQSDPQDAEALMDLSTVLHINGSPKLALSVQAQALEVQTLYQLPAPAAPAGIRLLALMAPGDLSANMPLEALLENSDVDLDMLYLLPGQPMPEMVPDHDVAIVAMSESEANCGLLKELEALAPVWPRPLINRPDRVARLSRDGAACLLRGTPGLVMPITARMDRATLAGVASGEIALGAVMEEGGFPLIVRPLDSHAGHDLAKLDDQEALIAYLGTTGAERFYVAPFVDYRSADGQYRKYRVVIIGGKPYAGHMAISSHWMIHYLNAGMDESGEKRAEEARFMADFDTDFAVRHGTTLAALNERLGLEYVGVDCGETADGKLLIFEVDHAMIVHAMDSPAVYPYKQPQMARVFSAFRKLLEDSRNGVPGR
ncbi:MAG: pyridoxal-dependent decarboxylase [Rhodocyclaceae bacterium]|nr:pyridoxal-dependent decarboxylase [Rhodocyclaceae bacterium]